MNEAYLSALVDRLISNREFTTTVKGEEHENILRKLNAYTGGSCWAKFERFRNQCYLPNGAIFEMLLKCFSNGLNLQYIFFTSCLNLCVFSY